VLQIAPHIHFCRSVLRTGEALPVLLGEKHLGASSPGRGPGELEVMYKHILLPTDGSELANQAVQHGIALAKQLGAKVTAVTVRPHLDDFIAEGVAITVSDEDRKRFVEATEHHLDTARADAERQGVPLETTQIESGQPWQAIVNAAADVGADLVVMASHGRRGLSALLLGSETQKVLTHSKIPVLVYR